jgi:hypothetical protein
LKGILKNQEFNSNDEIEKAMTRISGDLTFDNVQSIFQDWTAVWCGSLRTGESMLANKKDEEWSCFMNVEIGGRTGTVFTPGTLFLINGMHSC